MKVRQFLMGPFEHAPALDQAWMRGGVAGEVAKKILRERLTEEDWATGGPGNVAGFSLHAGVAVKAEPGMPGWARQA